MPNWDLIKTVQRKLDENCLYEDTVVVKVPQLTGAESDDLFEIPKVVSSGVYTIPCVFEFNVSDREKYYPGGAITDKTAFILADISWKPTFQQDQSYIEKNGFKYMVKEVRTSNVEDSMLVVIERKD